MENSLKIFYATLYEDKAHEIKINTWFLLPLRCFWLVVSVNYLCRLLELKIFFHKTSWDFVILLILYPQHVSINNENNLYFKAITPLYQCLLLTAFPLPLPNLHLLSTIHGSFVSHYSCIFKVRNSCMLPLNFKDCGQSIATQKGSSKYEWRKKPWNLPSLYR